MGFFKKIGKSIKNVTKAISIKNGIKVLSGQAGEVLLDVKNRALEGITKQPDKTNDAQVISYGNTLGDTYVKPLVNRVENQIANNKNAQGLSGILTKVYLKTMWTKYKNYIIGGVALIVVVVLSKKFLFKKRGRR